MKDPKNKTMFQWIRGERMGQIVKSTGQTIMDGNMEFMIFEDGTQCNVQLIGEWLMPIDSVGDAPYIPDPEDMLIRDNGGRVRKIAAPPAQVPPAARPAPPVEEYEEQHTEAENPVFDLLRKSKKKKVKMALSITVEMPSEELIRVIEDCYEDGIQAVSEFLVSSIDDDSINKQIEDLLKSKVEEITKKKSRKNESNS